MGLDITPRESELLTGIIGQVSRLLAPAVPFELYALAVLEAIVAEPRLAGLLDRATAAAGGPQALALMRGRCGPATVGGTGSAVGP